MPDHDFRVRISEDGPYELVGSPPLVRTAQVETEFGEPVGWDFNDKTRAPIMLVLGRKDRPIRPIDWDWDRSAVGAWQLGERR